MSLRLTIEQLGEGMVTEQPVINRFGQTVLGAGAVLNARHIEAFKAQGIPFVEVEGGANAGAVAISEPLRAAAAQQLRSRMDWEPHHAVEREIFQLSAEVLAERMAQEGAK